MLVLIVNLTNLVAKKMNRTEIQCELLISHMTFFQPQNIEAQNIEAQNIKDDTILYEVLHIHKDMLDEQEHLTRKHLGIAIHEVDCF
jgi:hypothetical protein